MEGVCQQLALVRDSVDAEGHEVTEVRATGGAVASDLWVGVLDPNAQRWIWIDGPRHSSADASITRSVTAASSR